MVIVGRNVDIGGWGPHSNDATDLTLKYSTTGQDLRCSQNKEIQLEEQENHSCG